MVFDRSQSTAGFSATSEFNRCNINSGICFVPARSGGSSSGDFPRFGNDLVEGPLGEERGIELLISGIKELVDSSFAADPLIEDPITSGSESIMWECDLDADGDCDEDDRDD